MSQLVTPRRAAALAMTALLAIGGAACGDDEDGDGAVTDEEVDQVDEGAEDAGDEVEDEVDQGADEVDDSK